MAKPPRTPGPLILTLTLDQASHSFLTDLRSKYFPPSRNFLSAHVTLFHAIPPHRQSELDHHLEQICRSTKGWDVFIGEPQKMGGRGVMVSLRQRPSSTIERIHSELLDSLVKNTEGERDKLTDQDKRRLSKPHITVLNKAESSEQVEECLEQVQKVFNDLKQPGQKNGQRQGRAIGFQLWEYLGGPWKPLKDYWLEGEAPR